jgi:hypothetical protein
MPLKVVAWTSALALATASVDAAPVMGPDPVLALKAFESQLDSHDSATAVLQAWCDAHGPKPGVRITARPAPVAARPLTAPARQALRPPPGQAVRYRRVDLMCGGVVLSHAENWYLPGRLTDDMNRRLQQTRAPFGVVVKGLNFTRRNLKTEVLLTDARRVPPLVLRHTAVLLKGDGTAFSYVVETYTDQVLSAGSPWARRPATGSAGPKP